MVRTFEPEMFSFFRKIAADVFVTILKLAVVAKTIDMSLKDLPVSCQLPHELANDVIALRKVTSSF